MAADRFDHMPGHLEHPSWHGWSTSAPQSGGIRDKVREVPTWAMLHGGNPLRSTPCPAS